MFAIVIVVESWFGVGKIPLANHVSGQVIVIWVEDVLPGATYGRVRLSAAEASLVEAMRVAQGRGDYDDTEAARRARGQRSRSSTSG